MVLGKDLTSERQQSLMHKGTNFDNWNKIEEFSLYFGINISNILEDLDS